MVARCEGNNALDSLPLEMIQGWTSSEARNWLSIRSHRVFRLRSAITLAKSDCVAVRMP